MTKAPCSTHSYKTKDRVHPGPASPDGTAVPFALVSLSSCVRDRSRLFDTVLVPGKYLNAGADLLSCPFCV